MSANKFASQQDMLNHQ